MNYRRRAAPVRLICLGAGSTSGIALMESTFAVLAPLWKPVRLEEDRALTPSFAARARLWPMSTADGKLDIIVGEALVSGAPTGRCTKFVRCAIMATARNLHSDSFLCFADDFNRDAAARTS